MWNDPIIEEIHKYRREHAEKFGNDLRKMVEDFKSREGKDGRKVVTLPPKPARFKPVEGHAKP